MLTGNLNIGGDRKQVTIHRDGVSRAMVVNQGPGDSYEIPVCMAANSSIRKCQMDLPIALELITS